MGLIVDIKGGTTTAGDDMIELDSLILNENDLVEYEKEIVQGAFRTMTAV